MPPAISQDTPIVFVVDDDVSVRESLELLIRFAGWEPETFAPRRSSSPAREPCSVLHGARCIAPIPHGLALQKLVPDRTDMPSSSSGLRDIPMRCAMKAGAVDSDQAF